MKIFLTGGSGFIGKNFIEKFKEKYTIVAPTSKILNLLDENEVVRFICEGGFDVIIHSAIWDATMYSEKYKSKVLENNLRMFFNIIKCSSYVKKIIYFGSGAEFSREHWIPKMSEEYFGENIPLDQYGFSKYIMCKNVASLSNVYNLRVFGVFGKYEDWRTRFISNTCARVVFDLPVIINKNVNFDYMHINDLLNITEYFICNSPEEKVFNVCTGEVNSLLQLAELVLKVANKDLEIKVLNEGLGKEYSGNNEKLKATIGKNGFLNLENSIKELYDGYLENKSILNKEVLLKWP